MQVLRVFLARQLIHEPLQVPIAGQWLSVQRIEPATNGDEFVLIQGVHFLVSSGCFSGGIAGERD